MLSAAHEIQMAQRSVRRINKLRATPAGSPFTCFDISESSKDRLRALYTKRTTGTFASKEPIALGPNKGTGHLSKRKTGAKQAKFLEKKSQDGNTVWAGVN